MLAIVCGCNEQERSSFRSPADPPVVTLKLGPNLNAEDIKEGDDVYFECHIQANPRSYKMAWFHNVSSDWPGAP